MPTLEPYVDDVYLWKYIPSLTLSIVFTGIFLVVTLAHLWKMVAKKMWFCTPFVIGGFFEVIGYACRAGAYNATGSLAPYLLQSLFLLLAPIFFAATLYMAYSRIVRAVHGGQFSLIRPRWTTRLFVFLDFSFFSVQSNGGGLLAKTKTAKIGSYIIVTGLILQLLGFIGFMVCCVVFHKRFHASRERRNTDLPWQSCLYMLYLTSLAVLARNLYRVVEFSMGTDGFLQVHEWPVYAFDASLMLAVMLVFFVWHPSTLYPHGVRPVPASALASRSASIEDGRDQRESMMELTGMETTFHPEGNASGNSDSGLRYKDDESRGFQLEDWFWPAKVWSLIKHRR
ncbi:hypothetical protein HMPREF1624_06802 [Sporothrix schenckii ATCC 58251]|uniref:RTA1 domain protein n=1 Tax=Sporothrix schenckii (strain ATCC 58251 / de Perez 2211183) TaxID=1391915 RepID=U7PLR8_SPOS1|nr:hypothetical protein HMPREF1624_06802 [Sporothrix schenckii ATCC 58251]